MARTDKPEAFRVLGILSDLPILLISGSDDPLTVLRRAADTEIGVLLCLDVDVVAAPLLEGELCRGLCDQRKAEVGNSG